MSAGVKVQAAASRCVSLLLSIVAVYCVGCAATDAVAPSTSPVVRVADDDVRGLYREASRRHSRNEEDAGAARDLGIAQVRLGQFRQAIEALGQAREAFSADPFVWAYEGLALEMVGDVAGAAGSYAAAAEAGGDLFRAVGARAGVLEARQATQASPEGDDSLPLILVLTPTDLLDAGSGAAEVIASCLGIELARSGRVRALSSDDADTVLRRQGVSLSDLDDPESEQLVRAVLRDTGVRWLLQMSFLHEDGIQYRGSISALRTGDTQSILDDVGNVGEELAPLQLAAQRTVEAVTGESSQVSGAIPTSFEAGTRLTTGIDRFESGDVDGGLDQFRLGLQDETAPELQRWMHLAQRVQQLEDPTIAVDQKPTHLVTYLRGLGQASSEGGPAPPLPNLTL